MYIYFLLLLLVIVESCFLTEEAENGVHTGRTIYNDRASAGRTILLTAKQKILFDFQVSFDDCHISIANLKYVSHDESCEKLSLFVNGGIFLGQFETVANDSKLLQDTGSYSNVVLAKEGLNNLKITTNSTAGIEIDQFTLQVANCVKTLPSTNCPQSVIVQFNKQYFQYQNSDNKTVDFTAAYIVLALVTGTLLMGILLAIMLSLDKSNNNNNTPSSSHMSLNT